MGLNSMKKFLKIILYQIFPKNIFEQEIKKIFKKRNGKMER